MSEPTQTPAPTEIPKIDTTPTSDTPPTTPQPPVPEELGDHEKAMVEKARAAAPAEDEPEAAGTTEEATKEAATKPDNVPEEFWDAEKGEVNLDALLEAVAKKPEDAPKEGAEETEVQADAPKTLETKFNELDIPALMTEVAENSGFTQETVEKLAEHLEMPPEWLETYGRGLAALGRETASEVFEITGGSDNFTAMIEWARDNLAESEADAINDALNRPNEAQTHTIIRGLYARYQAAEGQAPKLVGGEPGTAATDVYKDGAEARKDMADPRYQYDREFQQQVHEKMRRSKVRMV